MIRYLLTLALLQAASGASATPNYEGRRFGTSVTYEDGSTISLRCKPADECDLTFRDGPDEWTVRFGEFKGLLLLPSQLALVAREKNGTFVVESEIACDVYSEGLPAYTCLAQFTIKHSKVINVVILKRTTIDSRDAVPLIID